MEVKKFQRNLTLVTENGFSQWFSYQTLVAFRSQQTGLVVRKNIWSKTTEKHLTLIDGGKKDSRVDKYEFNRLLGVAKGIIKEAKVANKTESRVLRIR